MNKIVYYLKKLKRYIYLPFWYIYRMKYGISCDKRKKEDSLSPGDQSKVTKEDILRKILIHNKDKSLLEIGIGQFPNTGRLKIIIDYNIKYTGLDFDYVCQEHKIELRRKSLNTKNIRYLANQKGTYVWTLFQLLKKDERFDMIYLDGHHTFYIDLPAFFLIHLLLKKGGLLIVDDTSWTLSFLQKNMAKSYLDWYFYRKIYDFSQYDMMQQNTPHIKMITEEMMIKRYSYKKLRQYQAEDLWVLCKANFP